MPNIKPISDLRNYSEVLHDVAVGAPVFLTKNGRGRYAIVDMQDYERTQATIRLMNELAKGRRSAEEDGWQTSEEICNIHRLQIRRHGGRNPAAALRPGFGEAMLFAKTGDSFAHIENRKENGYSFSFPFAAFLRGFGLVSS